jgi:predicted helicase
MNKIPWILNLLDDYKRGLNEKKINLDDDFIKFIRLAHWNIVQTGVGCIGYITNNSYLDGVTHRQLRKSLLDDFQIAHFINLRGDSRKGELFSNGEPDENVFDIQQGVSIALVARFQEKNGCIDYEDLWGCRNVKYANLSNGIISSYKMKLSAKPPYYFFFPKNFDNHQEYDSFIPLRKIFIEDNTGIQTKRDSLTIHFTAIDLKSALNDLITLNDYDLRSKYDLPEDGRDWQVAAAKSDIGKKIEEQRIVRILYRPFDWRWTYFTGKTKGFLAYPRRETMKHMLQENLALITLRINGSDKDFVILATDCLIEKGSLPRGNYSIFPLYCYPEAFQSGIRNLDFTKRTTNIANNLSIIKNKAHIGF